MRLSEFILLDSELSSNLRKAEDIVKLRRVARAIAKVMLKHKGRKIDAALAKKMAPTVWRVLELPAQLKKQVILDVVEGIMVRNGEMITPELAIERGNNISMIVMLYGMNHSSPD